LQKKLLGLDGQVARSLNQSPLKPRGQKQKMKSKKMGRLYDGRRDRPVAWWQRNKFTGIHFRPSPHLERKQTFTLFVSASAVFFSSSSPPDVFYHTDCKHREMSKSAYLFQR
jgi:hypothetical protein